MVNTFSELNEYEQGEVSGGGVIGAAAGLATGVVGGGLLACVAMADTGSAKAGFTVWGSAIATCTVVGAVATGWI